MVTLKKSLGQHFLKDENICRKIVAVLKEQKFTQLLEVGPGGGALTKYLLELEGVDLMTVEIDKDKVDHLLEVLPAIEGKIIHEDFLDMDLPFGGQFVIVGNFPYNISTQILFKALEWKENVSFLVGMFQKEVAKRIAATEGSRIYGVTSVLVQAFFEVRYLFDVNENSFQPPPKVKSGVIRLSPRKEKLNMRTEKDFFLLVKTAFNQRRKTLRNAVKEIFPSAELAKEVFTKRAEQLKPQEFAELTFRMK